MKKDYQKGFTLAEILITLGIIGVVAAMTLPTLISNYKRKVAEVKLRQTYSILLNAVKQGESDTGASFGAYYPMMYHKDICPTGYEFYKCNNVLYQDFLKNHLSGNVIDLEESAWGKFPTNYAGTLFGKKFILPNSVAVSIYGGAFYIILNDHPKTLMAGRNTFQFGCVHANSENGAEACSKTLLPISSNTSRETLVTKCLSNNADTSIPACSQLFINDGLKFKKDYPIKF